MAGVAIDPTRQVSELLLENPARARVFEAHRIDYCCGGKKPLAEACARREVSVERVIEELAACDAPSGGQAETGPMKGGAAPSCAALIDDIVSTHHAYVRAELPRLSQLADKVARVHGDHAPEMIELAEVVRGLRAEMDSHMMKEEEVLFPMIQQLESGRDTSFPTIGSPISCMEHEHSDAGEALERVHALTQGLQPPPEACNSWRVLYHGLAQFERDLHQHVHKENNILFPRALALEQSVRAGK